MNIKILEELENQINLLESLWNNNFEQVKTFLSQKEQDDLYSLTTRLSNIANEHENYIQQLKSYLNSAEDKITVKYKRLEEALEEKIQELLVSEETIAQKLLQAKDTEKIKPLFSQISNLTAAKEFWNSQANDFNNGFFSFINHEFQFNSTDTEMQLSQLVNDFAKEIKLVRENIQHISDVYQIHKSLVEESLNYV